MNAKRKVMVLQYVQREDKKWKLEDRGEAIFHQFGCNYQEFETGPGNFTTAIIEWPNGTLENLPVHMVRFLDSCNPA
jgi:hypothetical protein